MEPVRRSVLTKKGENSGKGHREEKMEIAGKAPIVTFRQPLVQWEEF